MLINTQTMKNQKNKIKELELESTACALVDLDYDDVTDSSEIWEALYDKYSLDSDSFELLFNNLMDLLTFGISPVTQIAYVGLSKNDDWLFTKAIPKSLFIQNLLLWITKGSELPSDKKIVSVDILVEGEPLYEIQLTKK